MTEHDDFFARLRRDARPLRHQPDEATLERIRMRIHAHLAPQPTLAELLAAWFRPLAATALAIALAAGIGVMTLRNNVDLNDPAVVISVDGDTYRVAD
jgi:hypothetical protein